MVEINPQKLFGTWRAGRALDFHTTSSTPAGQNDAGHLLFNTVRPPIAELLFRLKYRQDLTAAKDITEAAAAFLMRASMKFEMLIPVPPSTSRPMQPVLVLAKGISVAVNIPYSDCIKTTRATSQLKNINDPAQRAALLDGLYTVPLGQVAGKHVLLFDDLYRSGSTLNAITTVLLEQGKAASVSVLAITRTRSHR